MYKLLSYALILLYFPVSGWSQFYIVEDTDGYVNLRGENNRIIGTVPHGAIVCWEYPDYEWSETDNMIYIFYKPEGQDNYITGNIHHSRLKSINTFQPFTVLDADTVRHLFAYLALDSIRITIRADYFDVNKHTITFNEDSTVIKAIDHWTQWYPNYGAIPHIEIKSLDIKINNQPVRIPKDSYGHLFDPVLYDYPDEPSILAFYDPDKKIIYIRLYGGDGGESYSSLLIIEDGEFTKQYMGN